LLTHCVLVRRVKMFSSRRQNRPPVRSLRANSARRDFPKRPIRSVSRSTFRSIFITGRIPSERGLQSPGPLRSQSSQTVRGPSERGARDVVTI